MTVEQYIEYINKRFEEVQKKPFNQWNVFMPAIRWM